MLRKKVLAGQRFMGRYLVAIDGTGIASYDYKHCDSCLSKTSKNGKTTYFHNVLEAKLITHSEMSLSIATEWISNHGKADFDKQDCEREAFKRLAEKIKKAYPRLPAIIVADGPYPWEGFFNICQQNRWNYIVTLKDNSLKTLQEDFHWEKRFNQKQKCQVLRVKDKKQVHLGYQCLQIAHIINQITELTTDIAAILKANKKFTIRYLWKRMISFMLEASIEKTEIDNLFKKRFQIRLE